LSISCSQIFKKSRKHYKKKSQVKDTSDGSKTSSAGYDAGLQYFPLNKKIKQTRSGEDPEARRVLQKSITSWLVITSQIPSHAKIINSCSSVIVQVSTSGQASKNQK